MNSPEARLKVLVFASKPVGSACARWLAESMEQDDYRFILGNERDDANLAQILRSAGFPVSFFGPDAQKDFTHLGPNSFDWILNLWSPHRLSSNLLALARHRLNLHPSLVPHARGNDNAAWTLRLAEPAGISMIEMIATIDEGDVWFQQEVPYKFPCRGFELHAQLIEKSIEFFKEQWPILRKGGVGPVKQNGALKGSYHKRSDTNLDRIIDLDTDPKAKEVVDKLLAHDFSPNFTAIIKCGDKRFRATLQMEEIG